MLTNIQGEIHLDFEHSKVVGGREIENIPFALIVIGDEEIDISDEIQVLMERHSQALEWMLAKEVDREDRAILSDRAQAQFEDMGTR